MVAHSSGATCRSNSIASDATGRLKAESAVTSFTRRPAIQTSLGCAFRPAMNCEPLRTPMEASRLHGAPPAAGLFPCALARAFFACRLRPGAAPGGRGTRRSQPLPQLAGGTLVDRPVASENHPVKLARGRSRHEAFGDVLRYALGGALQRIAPAAAPAGAHDGVGADRHRNMA